MLGIGGTIKLMYELGLGLVTLPSRGEGEILWAGCVSASPAHVSSHELPGDAL